MLKSNRGQANVYVVQRLFQESLSDLNRLDKTYDRTLQNNEIEERQFVEYGVFISVWEGVSSWSAVKLEGE